MAIIIKNDDGTYATKCSICDKPLTEPIFGTSHFIEDTKHHLWKFSDSSMHWDCYAQWEHQIEFANLYFNAILKGSENNPYWPIICKTGKYDC